MLYFFADNHYDKHPGLQMHKRLRFPEPCSFHEDDWSAMEAPNFAQSCSLLILNMIGDTCDVPHPNEQAERQIRAYAEKGGSFLLLHGSSAAFWKWDWWRPIVGLRWVRPHDPDGVAASTHPVRPYQLQVSKCRHPLCRKLKPVSFPVDEIYTELEQTCPVAVLMQTTTDEGTFPQCWECTTPWGGKILGLLPGHNAEAFDAPGFMDNVMTLYQELRTS